MCEPVTLALVAGGLAAGGVLMQNEQRKANNKIKDEAAQLQYRVYQNKAEQIANRFAGEQIQTSEELQQIKINAAKKRATSQVGASASGVEGLSVDAVLADFTRQEGVATSTVKHQLKLSERSTNLGLEATRLGTEGALFNLRKEKFNPAAAALQIGSAAFGGFTAGSRGPKKGSSSGTNTKVEFDEFGDML